MAAYLLHNNVHVGTGVVENYAGSLMGKDERRSGYMSWKKFLLAQVVICFLSLIFLGKVRAASTLWEYVKFGGSTGFEYLTFVDENRIVAATTGSPSYISGGSIYLSTDGGKSWSKTLENVPANTQT